MKYNLGQEFNNIEVDENKLNEIKELLGLETEWKPKEGEEYWYVSDCAVAWSFTHVNDEVDKAIMSLQQVYRTEEEAEFARDKAIFLEFMRKEFLRNSDVIDWEDAEQYKFSLEFGYQNDEILMSSSLRIKSNAFYTTNEYWLKQFIDKHEDDIKKYYFEVEK